MKSLKRQEGFAEIPGYPGKPGRPTREEKRVGALMAALAFTGLAIVLLAIGLGHLWAFWWPKPVHGGHVVTVGAAWGSAILAGIQWLRWRSLWGDS